MTYKTYHRDQRNIKWLKFKFTNCNNTAHRSLSSKGLALEYMFADRCYYFHNVLTHTMTHLVLIVSQSATFQS